MQSKIAVLFLFFAVSLSLSAGCGREGSDTVGGTQVCSKLGKGSIERAECECGMRVVIPDYLPFEPDTSETLAGCDESGETIDIGWFPWSPAARPSEPPQSVHLAVTLQRDDATPAVAPHMRAYDPRYEEARGVTVLVSGEYKLAMKDQFGMTRLSWTYEGVRYDLLTGLPADVTAEAWKVFNSIMDEIERQPGE